MKPYQYGIQGTWGVKQKTIAATVCLALATSLANAATYSNSNDADSILYFGAPDTTSYGQVFNTAGGKLSDWSFYATDGSAGDLALVVAGWDGSKAVGPALYNSSAFSYGGGAATLNFNGINANLSAGSYIAYLTVAGVGASPASFVAIAGSSSDGGLGGGFRFLNSDGTDPLTLSNAWGDWYIPNMQYTATINTTPVPEPETYVMLMAGLGLMGVVMRRRKRAD